MAAAFASMLLLAGGYPGATNAVSPIDIENPAESGDGAGCVFLAQFDQARRPVFVDRDDVGWIKVGTKVEQLRPTRKGIVMWPSVMGERLTLRYESRSASARLEVRVASGCASRYDDNCAVRYSGKLTVSMKGEEHAMPVVGHCVD